MKAKFYPFLFLCVAGLFFVTGCASTAKGDKRSIFTQATTEQTLNVTAPKGSVLAVVRYPAVVESDAQDAYREAYTNRTIGGSISKATANSMEAQNIADSAILKSGYFALSIFKELAARLPEHSVLLSPHRIKLDSDGSLTSEPITQAESLPSVVHIDFSTYSFPDAKTMMKGEPLTFGDLISPLVVVKTDHRARPGTLGLLVASRPLQAHAAGNSLEDIQSLLDHLQEQDLDAPSPELDFISFLSDGRTHRVPTQALGSSNFKSMVLSYPLEKLILDRQALAQLQSGAKGAVDPLRSVFSKNFANKIIRLLNDIPTDKAVMGQRAAVIAEYDPNLAALTFAGSLDLDYQARLDYAERLMEAEKKYLSVQSLRLFDGIHNSEMGAQVRDMLRAEYAILEKRRKLARQQNTATALAILGAVATGAVISQTDNSQTDNSQYNHGQAILTDLLLNASIYAGTQAFAYRNESRMVGNNYLTSIVPALEEQTNVQVNLIDSNETITAIRFEDLREKLQALYARDQRAISQVASQCIYTHDGTGQTGRWLGVCEGGLAAGSGVGIVEKSDGTILEYYGYAHQGQAEGTGYLIKHTPAQILAWDGTFKSGQPHGNVRVITPGSEDQFRRFENGQDVGRASNHIAEFTLLGDKKSL